MINARRHPTYQYSSGFLFVHCNGQSLRLHANEPLPKLDRMVREWMVFVA